MFSGRKHFAISKMITSLLLFVDTLKLLNLMPDTGKDAGMVANSAALVYESIVFLLCRTWSSSNLPDLFAAPLVKFVKEDMSDLEKDLRCHARTSNTLILWLDCDREGENIAMEIKEICCDENPNLEVKRARFSSVTRTDIMNAMANLTVIGKR